MALDPITGGEDLVKTIVQTFWPNKTQEEQNQLGAVLSMIKGQMAINQAEATSTDPLQHWRGGLGWVCVMGYFVNFPLQWTVNAVSTLMGHPVHIPPMDIGQLSTLTLGMLGLGGMHMIQQIKGR